MKGSGNGLMIYMDNAATTIHKPEEVKAAVMAAFDTMGNAGRGASAPALDASRVIYDAREKLARLFRAGDPRRIVVYGEFDREPEYRAERSVLQRGSCDHHSTGAQLRAAAAL